MALLFKPIYAGDTGTTYTVGPDTAVREFVVGIDDGTGDFVQTGAQFTPAIFYSMNGAELAKQQGSAITGLSVDQVQVDQDGPYTLRVTTSSSDSGFFDIGEITPTTPEGEARIYDFRTDERTFTIPYIITVDVAVPGMTETVKERQEAQYTDTTPVTTIEVECTVPVWNIDTIAFVNEMVGSIHSIPLTAGRLYRFKGTTSVRGRSDGSFRVRYAWEYDIGSRAKPAEVDSPLDRNPPKVFTDPTFSGRTFTGNWWRPPLCQVAVGVEEVDGEDRIEPGYFVDGIVGAETSYLLLPGNPIGNVS